MNKMKDEGYTEAERAAAEWRRQQKLTKVNSSADNRRNMNNNRRNEDRYDSDRNQRHRRSNSRTREIKTDNKDKKDNNKQTPEVDVFGRTILPGRKPSTQASERNDRRSRSPQYSRHRSDSNDHSHSRRSCSRSRSRSRSRRRKVDMDWNHDKFDSKEADYEDGPRVLPEDYRPPSPEWVSKAGGVAIMRKRIHTSSSITTTTSDSHSKLFK